MRLAPKLASRNMDKINDIGERLYGSSFFDIAWDPFGRTAELVFGNGKDRIVLRLSGLHLVSFRQAIAASEQPFGPDCDVSLVRVTRESEFLHSFLEKRLSYSSQIHVRDSNGKMPSSEVFRKPFHVLVVCGSGHLDAICEEAMIHEPGQPS